MRTFRYDPLPDPEKEIRVAVLRPGVFNDELIVDFTIRRLDVGPRDFALGRLLTTRQEENPGYEALSYVWGSEEDPGHVTVKRSWHRSRIILITGNLEIALRHPRHERDPRYMWIDALCIDQKNIEEKNVQVAIMGVIYEKSDLTVSWLGPEENNSNTAIRILQEVADNVEVNWNLRILQPSAAISRSPGCSESADQPNIRTHREQLALWGVPNHPLFWNDDEMHCMTSLLVRPYFERAWILQEIKLSAKVLFQCGFATITENDVWDSIFCFYRKSQGSLAHFPLYPTFQRALRQVYAIAKLRSAQGRHLSYEDLRFRVRTFQCRDPRDKVYAVLSFFSGIDEAAFRPNYSLEAGDIYINITQLQITSRRTLDVLQACELSTRYLDIPSWVPDWSTRLRCEEPLFETWSACGFISAQASFDVTSSYCTVFGVSISEVTEVTEYELKEALLPSAWPLFQAFLKAIKPSNDTFCAYPPNAESLIEAYSATLAAKFLQDIHIQHRPRLSSLKDVSRLLQAVWSGNLDVDSHWSRCMKEIHLALTGRCFITTLLGHIGLAPTGTRLGDIVCIVLGSSFPVVLRPATNSDGHRTWLVVGVCYVHGLMDGETIYRSGLDAQYRSVWHDELGSSDRIGNRGIAFQNLRTGVFRTDPAELLQEAGIKVEEYQRWPHKLVVLPETLREAGIPLEDFVLV